MPNDNTQAGANTDPSQNTDGSSEDTQSIQNQTSPVSESANGHDENANNAQTALQDSNETNDQEGYKLKTPVNEETAEERVRRIESKLVKEQERAQQLEQRFNTISEWATKDPERYKQALIETSGFDPQQAEQKVQELKQQGVWNQNNNQIPPQQQYAQQQQQDTNQQNYDVNSIKESVKNELVLEDAIKHFTTNIAPEFSLDNLQSASLEERQQKADEFKKISALADAFMVNDSSLDQKKALVEAYKHKTGKTEEEIQSAREEGRIEGLAQANYVNSQSQPTAQGRSASKKTASISDELRNAAKLVGASEEEAAKYSKGATTVDW